MRRITPQQLMNGKRRKKKQKRDMDPVNLKKAVFGLGGYRHNHPPSISLGNKVTSSRDENCPRRGLVQFSSLGHVTSIPCEKDDRAVISSVLVVRSNGIPVPFINKN
jgi:hypothetical protein